jgi:hypothetical protein
MFKSIKEKNNRFFISQINPDFYLILQQFLNYLSPDKEFMFISYLIAMLRSLKTAIRV